MYANPYEIVLPTLRKGSTEERKEQMKNLTLASFVPLRPFFCAALAKRWKVQFRKGLHKFNNVDSKTTYFSENCCIM